MTKKNVLYITHRVPYPPNKGDRIRTYQFIKDLAKSNNLYLATLVDEPLDQTQKLHLEGICSRVAYFPLSSLRLIKAGISMLIGHSASEGYFSQRSLMKCLRSWKNELDFHTVIASSSALAKYYNLFKNAKSRVFVDFIDVDSCKWADYALSANFPKSWVYQTEAKRLKNLEKITASWSDGVTLVSQAEVNLLLKINPQGKIYCVKQGVDVEQFQTSNKSEAEQPFSCVFIGALDYLPNYQGLSWFVKEVWQNLVLEFSEAVFYIVGKSPGPLVFDLGKYPGVKVVGEVPDVKPWLNLAEVCVAPLKIGRGVQTKVLESMAMEVATIVSPEALQGIAACPERHLVLAKTSLEWQAAIKDLWTSPKKRRELGKNGCSFVRGHHSWQQSLVELKRLLALDCEGI